MSKVDFRNCRQHAATHAASDRTGDLHLCDRVVSRGRGKNLEVAMTFEAIFTFEDPIICLPSEVPNNGGYFLEEDGMAEVTQLIGRFASDDERGAWLASQFKSVGGQ